MLKGKNESRKCLLVSVLVLVFHVLLSITISYGGGIEKGAVSERGDKRNIVKRYSITFRNDVAIKIEQKMMGTGELTLWENEAKLRRGNVLECALLQFDDEDDLFVNDAMKDKPFVNISAASRIYKVKNEKGKIWIKGDKSKWMELSIKFIKEIPEKEHAEETYPCMLLELSCKWFRGKYVLWDYSE